MIQDLANLGADLEFKDTEGNTPMYFAIQEGNVAMAEALIKIVMTRKRESYAITAQVSF